MTTLCRECCVDPPKPNDHLCHYCAFARDFNASADARGLERQERAVALLQAIAEEGEA